MRREKYDSLLFVCVSDPLTCSAEHPYILFCGLKVLFIHKIISYSSGLLSDHMSSDNSYHYHYHNPHLSLSLCSESKRE